MINSLSHHPARLLLGLAAGMVVAAVGVVGLAFWLGYRVGVEGGGQ